MGVERSLPGKYQSNYVTGITSPASAGFDATLRFQPDYTVPAPTRSQSLLRAGAAKAIKANMPWLHRGMKRFKSQSIPDNIFDYAGLYGNWQNRSPRVRHFECVTPMWDNSARRYRGATIVKGSPPDSMSSGCARRWTEPFPAVTSKKQYSLMPGMSGREDATWSLAANGDTNILRRRAAFIWVSRKPGSDL